MFVHDISSLNCPQKQSIIILSSTCVALSNAKVKWNQCSHYMSAFVSVVMIYESENLCSKNIEMIVISLVFPLCGIVSSFIQQFECTIFRCSQIAAICGSEIKSHWGSDRVNLNLNSELTGCKCELVLAIPNKNHLLVHHHQQQCHHLPNANIYQFVLQNPKTISILLYFQTKCSVGVSVFTFEINNTFIRTFN